MTNKEAIKYLIVPIATSTVPSTEYLKMKEAYDLAIKALEERPTGNWIWNKEWSDWECPHCGHAVENRKNFCAYCGADLRGENQEKVLNDAIIQITGEEQ